MYDKWIHPQSHWLLTLENSFSSRFRSSSYAFLVARFSAIRADIFSITFVVSPSILNCNNDAIPSVPLITACHACTKKGRYIVCLIAGMRTDQPSCQSTIKSKEGIQFHIKLTFRDPDGQMGTQMGTQMGAQAWHAVHNRWTHIQASHGGFTQIQLAIRNMYVS